MVYTGSNVFLSNGIKHNFLWPQSTLMKFQYSASEGHVVGGIHFDSKAKFCTEQHIVFEKIKGFRENID